MLSLNKRKAYFKALGLGEYNKASILKLQQKYFTRAKDCDGVYGNNTDILLRHVYNVETYTKNFSPAEFKCGCGGKHCTGYPTYMKPAELKNLQTIRSHYGKPITITCGLRCKGYNAKLRGSVSNSLHLKGQAIDFYMAGHTDTLTRRKNTINYIRKLANHNYAYGNGYCSGGYAVSAPNMGNAIHFDTKNNPVKGFATRVIFKAKQAVSKKPVPKTANEKARYNAVLYGEKLIAEKRPYKKWNESVLSTHLCSICHPESGRGFSCIAFAGACVKHGGGYGRCGQAGLGNDLWFTQIRKTGEPLKRWKARHGNNWTMSKKLSSAVYGDIIVGYSNGKYKHTMLKGFGKDILDSTSKRGCGKGTNASKYDVLVFHYTGKGKY